MQAEEERLNQEITKMTAEAERVDQAEDKLYGKNKRGDEIPKALRHPEKRLVAIRKAKAELEKRAAQKKKKDKNDDDKPPTPQGKDQYNRGPMPKNMTMAEAMRRFLSTKRGRMQYALRKITVEPVFGQIKSCMGFRQFSLRGLTRCEGEWNLICTCHNLLKLYRFGTMHTKS